MVRFRGRRGWRSFGAASLAALHVFTVAGCQSSREVHTEGDGPLSSQRGGGISVMDKASGQKSWGTFQGALLCVHEPGERIELQRAGWRAADATVEPLTVKTVLHYVDAETERRSSGIEAIRGTPQKPEEGEPYPGRYSEKIRGVVIDQPCSEVRETGHGYTELLFVVEFGKQGFSVPESWIDYLADGQEYRLRLQWRMAACGDVFAESEDGDAC